MPRDTSKIHPELATTARYLPNFRYSRGSLAGIRLLFRTVFLVPKAHRGIRTTTLRIPSAETGRLRVRLYSPRQTNTPVPVLVWFHGGGHVVGNLNMSDDRIHQYVDGLGIAVVSVDYRLAPDHPFPADLNDAYTALKWVHDQAQALGVDPRRIAVGGESAGGGLAAALAQRAHDRGEVKVGFQLLVYPMLDDRTGFPPESAEETYLVWTPAANRFAWQAYLGGAAGSTTVPDGSVPGRRADLSGLPPAWIGVGTQDLFHNEDVAYAQRLKASGVDCELLVVPGAFHGFDDANPRAQVSQDFCRSQVAALKRHLFPPSS